MSTIVGLLTRKSEPPSRGDVGRVLAAATWSSSRSDTAIDGRCGVGAAVLPLTHEDLLDGQPYRLGDSIVALAGRIDNRAQLAAELGLPREVSDVRLAAHAYRAWGSQCPELLVGSFALICWDGAQERLFCAVDHLATRSLFYADGPHGFVVGSTIRQVRAYTGVGDDLDEPFLLASLCMPSGAPLQSQRTPYVGVKRLLRGMALVVSSGSVRTWRYWRPEELPETKAALPELGAALRERLEVAVREQSRTHGKVMCTLSGGLDSSTVTGLVVRHHRSGDLPAKGFEAVSLEFDGGSDADESPFRRAAEERFGVSAVLASGREGWHFRDIGPGAVAPPADEPFLSYAAYAETSRFAAAAAETDCTVVLFGHGGDELLSGSEHFVADLLAEGRVLEAWRRSRELGGYQNRTYASSFRALALGPVLATLRPSRAGISWDGATDDWDTYWYRPPAPPWLRVDRRRREQIEQVWQDSTTLGMRPYSRAHELSWTRSAAVTPALNDCVFSPLGQEMRSPFYDRRVVELALSIPGATKLKVVDGTRVTKLVLRKAVDDLLPRSILERRTKASLSVGSAEGLRREWARIWNDGAFEVVRRGFVDGEMVGRALRSARMGQWENIAHLTALVVLEFWLRSHDSQPIQGRR
ncbi:MAG TPA: asparagine synthase-related protein [Actinopolymorphaceae bacterium]